MANKCKTTGKTIFTTELDAKIALAKRVWRDKGEVRAYRCPRSSHWHLTSIPLNGEVVAA